MVNFGGKLVGYLIRTYYIFIDDLIIIRSLLMFYHLGGKVKERVVIFQVNLREVKIIRSHLRGCEIVLLQIFVNHN